jgi:hypothetical protein
VNDSIRTGVLVSIHIRSVWIATTASLVLPAASTRATFVSTGHMGRRTGLVLRVGSSENSNEVVETLFHVIRELPVSGRRQKQFVEHEGNDADKDDINAKPPIPTNDDDE